jgi:hypothetical protein
MAKKILAALALVIMGFFAAPLAANAAGYSGGTVSFSGSFAAGGTANVQFSAGSFQANESVHVTVSGAGAVTFAAFKADTISSDKTAAADGSLAVAVKLPADASGTYTVTGTGATSGSVVSGTFTVGANGGGGGSNAGGSGLADTGSTISILAFWVAGGVVLLGAAFVAVRVVVRRQARTNA